MPLTGHPQTISRTVSAAPRQASADLAPTGNQELELYMSDEVYVENGNLVLRTRYNPTYYGSKLYQYTSGWVDTQVGLVIDVPLHLTRLGQVLAEVRSV